MPLLKIDKEKCVGCNNCEKLLPSFKSKHNGDLFISWAKLRDNAHIKQIIDLAIKECKSGALSLKPA